MQELNPKTILVSAHGGILDYLDPTSGEVLFSIAVPPGKFRAGEYLDLAPEGVKVEIAEGLVALQPKGWAATQPAQTEVETGANPDFQPTSADRLQRQMALTMRQMLADQKTLNAKLQALSQIERIPSPAPAKEEAKADDAAGGEVVE